MTYDIYQQRALACLVVMACGLAAFLLGRALCNRVERLRTHKDGIFLGVGLAFVGVALWANIATFPDDWRMSQQAWDLLEAFGNAISGH